MKQDSADVRLESFALDKRQARVGDTLKATVAVSNWGFSKAKSARLLIMAAPGSNAPISQASQLHSMNLGTLGAKVRFSYVANFPVPSWAKTGTYRVFATVDTQSRESKKGNNTNTSTLEVIGTTSSVSTSSGGSSSASVRPPSSSSSSFPSATGPTLPDPECDYYASPTGTSTNDGVTPLRPFRPQDFWALARPGKTLCLMNGTYRGSGFMIAPPSGLSGSQTSPITIRALNEGKVLIDGQGARQPVIVSDANWVLIQGFNACCSNNAVVKVTGGSADVTVRRVVAWDAKDSPDTTDFMVFEVAASARILLEDVGGFGRGRKIFQFINSDAGTCRRCWGRWEGYESSYSQPRGTLQPSYKASNALIENNLMTWNAEQVPTRVGQADAVIYVMNEMPGLLRVLGSVGYVKCDAASFNSGDIVDNTNTNSGDILLQDLIAVYEPGCFTSKLGFNLRNASGPNLTVTRATTWGGSGANTIGSDWAQSNVCASGTFPGSCPNPYTGARGANVCKRYVNGALTNEALWPWPMNQRILDATTAANRTPVDVTAEVEQLLGPIPAVCRN